MDASDFYSAIVATIALGVSYAAYRLATRQFQREKPMIRVVQATETQVGVFGRGAAGLTPMRLRMDAVILKNIGRVPAVSVIAFDPAVAAIIGTVDVVEPLGPGEEERTRIGRVGIQLAPPMEMHHSYELYYQDALGGAWHLTRFEPRPPTKIEYRFVGEINKVPAEVEAQRTVAAS